MARGQEVRALDLFCGAGGSSCGAEAAGAVPVAGVDLWNLATETYQLNFPDAKTYTNDISSLSPREVAKDVGPIDLILASPECTHHSIARGAKERDDASRRLAFDIIRFAAELRPRWLIVENVVQMGTWDSFEDWHNKLVDLGYWTLIRKLNAYDFGVPQSRRRLFVICDRQGQPAEPRKRRRKTATARSILQTDEGGLFDWPFTRLESARRAAATVDRAKRAIDTVGERTPFLMVYYGSDAAGGFQTLDRPLRTITTLDRFALVRPNGTGHEMRMLQPPELAAAMGFPKRYRWPAITRRNRIKLIGNAVCPPIMRAIVSALVQKQ